MPETKRVGDLRELPVSIGISQPVNVAGVCYGQLFDFQFD
jgi:hypothetical protein